jgi:hypothetical protein
MQTRARQHSNLFPPAPTAPTAHADTDNPHPHPHPHPLPHAQFDMDNDAVFAERAERVRALQQEAALPDGALLLWRQVFE